MEKEKEVKVLGIDIEEFEQRVLDAGGVFRAFERQENILIHSDHLPDQSYLRLRITRDLTTGEESRTLTYKEFIGAETLRKNKEYSTEISNQENLLTIFEHIGWDTSVRAFKTRKSYLLRGAIIDIDRWEEDMYPDPYAEIEVPNDQKLEEIVQLLQIDPNQLSTLSIKDLSQGNVEEESSWND